MVNNIKKLRVSRGFSQSYVAEQIGVSRQSYIKYEHGDVQPGFEVIIKLSHLYNVPASDFVECIMYPDDEGPEFNSERTYKISGNHGEMIVTEEEPHFGKRAVYLDEADYEMIAKEALREGTTISYFIHSALNTYLKNSFKKNNSLLLDSFEGKCKSFNRDDALDYQKKLREEERV